MSVINKDKKRRRLGRCTNIIKSIFKKFLLKCYIMCDKMFFIIIDNCPLSIIN